MRRQIKVPRQKSRVRFAFTRKSQKMANDLDATAAFTESMESQGRMIEELSDDEDDGSVAALPRSAVADAKVNITPRFTSHVPIVDPLNTETSILQDETVAECLPFLACTDDEQDKSNQAGIPHLRRGEHTRFLRQSLKTYPSYYAGYDASRPWLLYWALAALSILGEDVTQYRDR